MSAFIRNFSFKTFSLLICCVDFLYFSKNKQPTVLRVSMALMIILMPHFIEMRSQGHKHFQIKECLVLFYFFIFYAWCLKTDVLCLRFLWFFIFFFMVFYVYVISNIFIYIIFKIYIIWICFELTARRVAPHTSGCARFVPLEVVVLANKFIIIQNV